MGIVKDALYRLSHKSFLPLVKQQTIFPYYHLINDEKVAHIKNLYEYKNVAQFERDLDFLIRHYKPATPGQILDGKVPENSFLLTFDDGLAEVYSVIYPILKKRKLSAIFFINPDYVDNERSLYKHEISVIIEHLKKDSLHIGQVCKMVGIQTPPTHEFWERFKNVPYQKRGKIKDIIALLGIDMERYRKQQPMYITKMQIQEMIEAGFYFGGHTMSHPPLHALQLEDQRNEIIDSIDWLKQSFGIRYSMFAFPFSDKSASKKLLDALFSYDQNIRIFGNAGIKKDIDSRIIQRFSLENPHKDVDKQIITENLYKSFNRIIGKYHIIRK